MDKTAGLAAVEPIHRHARHTRVRTGCITCKIRKLRCDEQKPACNRCVSTGRKCDGYTSPATSTHPTNTGKNSCTANSLARQTALASKQNPAIPLPRRNTHELRSYHFFLHVTAPSLAGVFDVDFWLCEVPRACHIDVAIWHAVISLGAIHESHLPLTIGGAVQPRDRDQLNLFALGQFNSSIRHLLQVSLSGERDMWRALTSSVIFTYICSLQGLQSQALVHLKAGQTLLKELITARKKRSIRSSAGTSTSPVSFDPLYLIITSLDIQSRALQNGGLANSFHLLINSDSYTAWRYYESPPISHSSAFNSSSGLTPCATPDNIARAGRAFESLLNSMVAFTQERAADIASVLTSGDQSKLEELIKGQEPFTRAFRELSAAIEAFTSGAGASWSPGSKATIWEKTAISTLRLYQATVRVLLYRPPDFCSAHIAADLPSLFSRIVDLSELILREALPCLTHDGSPRPLPTPTAPLFLVAHSGTPRSTRRRAIDVLRTYPRREGLWDTCFSAELAEHILGREEEVSAEIQEGEIGGGEMARIHDMRVTLDGERRMRVVMRTWVEWGKGEEGVVRIVRW